MCVNPADIKILKTADASSVNAGDPIGFTITVWNAGAGDAAGVKLNDTLPTNAGLYWTIDGPGRGLERQLRDHRWRVELRWRERRDGAAQHDPGR